ncbi:AAA domain-containing protein [Sinorhizobium meliloti]|nr:AAA domain-containing protein [Sinorhizobium meliloti]
MVRPGTLRFLEELPPDWNAAVIGGAAARLLAQSARAALEDRARADSEATIQRIAKEVDDAREQQAEQCAALAEERAWIETELAEGNDTLARVRAELRDKQELLDNLLQRNQLMEERFRHLSDLLAQKGERLRALGLVDEVDLEALLPPANKAPVPEGRGFEEVLEGNFARIAPFLQAHLWRDGMLFSQAQLRDFLALARTHDLVVLAGDSGAGKTSLVRAVASAIGARCTVIPVKPNWTGPEDLLGYYNPIERRYHPTPFLQALQAAEREPRVLHFICLDEMNLARVEHYFADFLSLLEARTEPPLIPLYTSDEERHTVMENGLFLALEAEARQRAGLSENTTLEDLLKNETANRILHQLGGFKDAESVLIHHGRLRRALAASMHTPTELRFPVNLRIFGAINVDETTHYLSPKVLDRVHVLRFRNPVLIDWEALEAEIESFDPDEFSKPLCLAPEDFGPRADYPGFDRTNPAAGFLTTLARDHLDPLGIEFGLRAIRQSLGYLRAADIAGIDATTALNNVILHKVLPKLTLDLARTGSDGRNRRDGLIGLRDYLDAQFDRKALAPNVEDCVAMLDRLIAAAQGNNGIANYWLR